MNEMEDSEASNRAQTKSTRLAGFRLGGVLPPIPQEEFPVSGRSTGQYERPDLFNAGLSPRIEAAVSLPAALKVRATK